ncbi:MAG: response regulator [Cytophagaceae bacterium]
MLTVKSVLILEDDNIETFLVKSELKKIQSVNSIFSAEKISEAMNVLKVEFLDKNSYPDIILLDLKLGLSEGWEFIVKLQNQHPDVLLKSKIFILTNSTSQRDIKKARSYNVAGYIEKPFNMQKLIPALACEQFILVV